MLGGYLPTKNVVSHLSNCLGRGFKLSKILGGVKSWWGGSEALNSRILNYHVLKELKFRNVL